MNGGHIVVFKDKTFCASPNCTNECGRKMTEDERKQLDAINNDIQRRISDVFLGKSNSPIMMNNGVSYAYFCGEPESNEEE
jgi:hypothetical protein